MTGAGYQFRGSVRPSLSDCHSRSDAGVLRSPPAPEAACARGGPNLRPSGVPEAGVNLQLGLT